MLSRSKIWIILMVGIAVLVNQAPLFAQSGAGKTLSLEECINIALENNSSLKNAAYSNKSADMDVLGSYQGILPTLSVSAGRGEYETGPAEYLSNEPVGLDEDGNVIYELRTRKTDLTTRKSTTAGVTVNQNIFDGGVWWNQIRKSKADQKSSQFSYKSQRDNTILQVQQAYFDLIKQIKLLEVYDLAVKRSEAQLERTQKMYDLGATAKVDVFRTKVNLGNDRISYLQQVNTVEQSRKTLNLAMGRDPFTAIDVRAEIPLLEAIPSVDDLVETAFQHQPMLMKNELDMRSRDLQVSLAKGLNYPKISAYLRYNRFHENATKVFSGFDQNYQTQYGVSLSFNLFNGFSDYTTVQKAELAYKMARENLEAYKRELKSNVHQYYADYKSTLDIIEINKQNLEAAKEELRLEQERNQVGAGTALEVREAQVNLTRAEETLVSAQFTARLILARLDNALGLTYQKIMQ